MASFNIPKRPKPLLEASYPEYDKSLVSQKKEDPTMSGLTRGLGTGAGGAILAALLVRMLTDNPKAVLGAAGVGALAGAVPGYISGRDEAISNYSKLRALRRHGIETPFELWGVEKLPERFSSEQA